MISSKVVNLAAEAFIEICGEMLEISCSRAGTPRAFSSDGVDAGAWIGLTSGTRSWNLAVAGDMESCAFLTRALFGMEPDEEVGKEELADALGEIANMTAGVVKQHEPTIDGEEAILGLPVFFSNPDCLKYVGKGIAVTSQAMAGRGLQIQVTIMMAPGS